MRAVGHQQLTDGPSAGEPASKPHIRVSWTSPDTNRLVPWKAGSVTELSIQRNTLGINTCKWVKEARLGKEKSWTAKQLQQRAQSILTGGSGVGWPFKTIPSWGNRLNLHIPIPTSHWMKPGSRIGIKSQEVLFIWELLTNNVSPGGVACARSQWHSLKTPMPLIWDAINQKIKFCIWKFWGGLGKSRILERVWA